MNNFHEHRFEQATDPKKTIPNVDLLFIFSLPQKYQKAIPLFFAF